jgi:hypothetical protein
MLWLWRLLGGVSQQTSAPVVVVRRDCSIAGVLPTRQVSTSESILAVSESHGRE